MGTHEGDGEVELAGRGWRCSGGRERVWGKDGVRLAVLTQRAMRCDAMRCEQVKTRVQTGEGSTIDARVACETAVRRALWWREALASQQSDAGVGLVLEQVKAVLFTENGRKQCLKSWTSSLFRDVPAGAIQIAVFEGLKIYILTSPSA
eukprot:2955622-Rhodomonas_salina.1